MNEELILIITHYIMRDTDNNHLIIDRLVQLLLMDLDQ